MTTTAHFTAFLTGVGYHESAWRVRSPEGTTGPAALRRYAQIAERGLLDSAFFADSPVLEIFRARYFPQVRYDPIALVASAAAATSHIGLVATASTTYNTPYDLARRLSTADHLTRGRAGWNVVTTMTASTAANFGLTEHPKHADRYARASEFVEVVRALWDEDAHAGDNATGLWAEVEGRHPPLPRSPQGQPVLAQAGASASGVDLAGRFADLVFTAQPDLSSGRRFRAALQAAARKHGRPAGSVLALPGLAFVLGSTEAEALARREELESLVDPEFRWRNLVFNAGFDLSKVDPDARLTEAAVASSGRTSRTEALLKRTRETGKTARELSLELTGLPGGLEFTGTPEQLAELIEQWVTEGGSDGFTLQSTTLPDSLELFVDHVVPLLQKRGLHRTEYTGTTLRDHLGLAGPPTS